MSNGSTNGNATNNIKGNSAIPPIKSYEEDRNATSQDVYVDLLYRRSCHLDRAILTYQYIHNI